MRRNHLSNLAAALLCFLCGSAPLHAQGAPPEPPAGDEMPKNVVYPVMGWVPLYGVDLRLPAGPPCTGCPPDSTSAEGSSGLSGAWFAAVRLEGGRFSVAGNLNWAGLSAEKDRPFFKMKADLFTAVILGGVRVYGAWFLEAGGRYHGLDTTFSVLDFPSVDWNPGRWAPAVGTTFRPRLGRQWMFYTHLDVAGLGVHDISTVNGTARIEWRPARHLALTGGYGFGVVTLDGRALSKPIHLEQTLHGPIAGIGFPF